jgi:hypothetical protein
MEDRSTGAEPRSGIRSIRGGRCMRISGLAVFRGSSSSDRVRMALRTAS